jgi:3-mercaptopyruvate sulfurtransferase SseA
MEDVTLAELRTRLGEEGLVVLDVRSRPEFAGSAGAHCDPRQGHIAGARNVPLDELLACRCAEDVRVLVGAPEATRPASAVRRSVTAISANTSSGNPTARSESVSTRDPGT